MVVDVVAAPLSPPLDNRCFYTMRILPVRDHREPLRRCDDLEGVGSAEHAAGQSNEGSARHPVVLKQSVEQGQDSFGSVAGGVRACVVWV